MGGRKKNADATTHLEDSKVIVSLTRCTRRRTRVILDPGNRLQRRCVRGIKDAEREVGPVHLNSKVVPIARGEGGFEQEIEGVASHFEVVCVGDG